MKGWNALFYALEKDYFCRLLKEGLLYCFKRHYNCLPNINLNQNFFALAKKGASDVSI